MPHQRCLRLAACAWVACLSGCFSVEDSNRQSWWLVPPTPSFASDPTRSGPVLALVRSTAASQLSGMVVLRPDGRHDTLIYEAWAEPIPETVVEWMRSRLLDSEHFSAVLAPRDVAIADYELALHTHRFEWVESPEGGVEATIVLEGSLVDRERRFVWAGRRTTVQSLSPGDHSVETLVAALAQALAAASADLADSLLESVRSQALPASGQH